MRTLFRFLLACTAALILAAAGGWVVLEAGWYDAGAVRQHFQLVHTLLERGMHQSVRFHARDIQVPKVRDAVVGAVLYKQNCQQCHGGPGMAQDVIGMPMQPVPGPLVDAAKRFRPNELYWVVRNGIKMSGMPAWGFHLREDEMWAVVAFLERLPHMTPDEYRTAGGPQPTRDGAAVTGAAQRAPGAPAPAARGGEARAAGTEARGGEAQLDAARGDGRDATGAAPRGLGAPAAAGAGARGGDVVRGKVALTQWACQACHRIPGVTGPDVHVGPPLKDLRKRKFIAGSLPASQDNLVLWIMRTHSIDPQTAMPQLGVPERDARDMAAYLLNQ